MVKFNLATHIIPDTQSIWSVFPGQGKRYLRRFLDEKVIFLDMPGVALNATAIVNIDLLRRHVAMSNAILKWNIEGRSGSEPSRKIADYKVKKSKTESAALANVRGMFSAMKKGDLILFAGASVYDPVNIGEITADFTPTDVMSHPRYPREEIPFRSVRWIQTKVERRDLSQDLSLLLSNRRAIISIPKSLHGEEVYRIAYGDYVLGDNARYKFHGPDYANYAPTTVPGLNLISYFAAAFNAIEEDELEAFLNLSIDEAIKNYFEQDALYSFEIDFASPGGYILHAKKAVLPLFVAVMVAASGNPAFSLDELKSANITNSVNIAVPSAPSAGQQSVSSQCVLDIKEKYEAMMEVMGAKRWQELCKMNAEAKDGVGLRVNVKPSK